MSSRRVAAVTVAAAIIWVGTVAPVRGQSSEPPSNAPVQVGPLALAPVIRLTNFGHDSNVNNRSLDNNPQADLTATLSPTVETWLRLPHARVNSRSQFDFYYFKQLTDLRALDTDIAARAELPLNRLTPFFEGTLVNTRHRWNLEIDGIARRRNEGVGAGADLRLTAKVSAGAYARRSRVAYEPNSLYLGTDLARVLNHKSDGEGIRVRYALTPLTTLAVDVGSERDRFEFSGDRNADSLTVTPSVEFNPWALVSGRASIGFRKRRFLAGKLPEFNGTTALVDLNYTLRGQTRFGVSASRDLEYSYIVLADYVLANVTATVTHRFVESWDVGGSLGRGRLSYRQLSSGSANFSDETVLTSGADVGYSIGHGRVGFHVERQTRQSDVPTLYRGYRRLRIGSTLTYAF